MDVELETSVRRLLEEQPVASLGTVDAGDPYVSMVPFVVLDDGDFAIHVSALAAHTRHMLAHPRVSLLVIAQPAASVMPQALARLTIQGEAAPLGAGDPHHAAARAAYLGRFPESAQTFELGDFSLFAIRPTSARFVGGFAQARTLTPETLSRIARGGPGRSLR
jgi:putative heme iron utilization protein